MKTNFNFETTLSELLSGDSGRVVRVEDDGPVGRRLLDLGLLPDTPVRVVRRAPLGDPIELELRGYHLCLRQSEARRVLVQRTP
ncbi:MAG: FeoA family protein [Proteobacteria bacterium]|nr:FeoA family protein [Pseudomonadota bacterium]